MPRGVAVIGETQAEAERQALGGRRDFRVISSREIDLSAVPPLAGGPLPKHWLVVVEHVNPEEEAKLPQDDDPEVTVEEGVLQTYIRMAIDPALVVSGVIEEFACPRCDGDVRVELPASHEARDPEYASCPSCRSHLTRSKGQLEWRLAPPKQGPKLCLFCDSRANSKEHVIPEWISTQLGVKDFLYPDRAASPGHLRPRKQPISFASYRARIFCGGCNEHFGHLEDEVIPLLVPMARGRILGLDIASQTLLALWATKTAIALATAMNESREVAPLGHRTAIRAGRVADDTWVGFSPWAGGPVLSSSAGTVTTPVGSFDAYSTFLAFRGVAFSVTGFHGPVGPGAVVDGPNMPPVRQFWPLKTPLHEWSTPPVADDRILPRLLSFVPLQPATPRARVG